MPSKPPALPQFPPPVRIDLDLRKLGFGVIALIVAMGIFSSFYTVPVDSEAVVQRFGAYQATTPSGLHFKIPFGVDTVEIVPTRRQLKLEFGTSTGGATNDYQYTSEQEDERSMVTGDLNAANVEWVVQYGIQDAKAYLFAFNRPESTLRDVTESVVREIVGDRTIDEVLTTGREAMGVEAKARLEKIVTDLGLGFRIEGVQLIDVYPPREVRASFDEVNSAKQEREQTVNVARRDFNAQVPQAEGEALKKISIAEGYATKRVNEAEGDVNRFNALLTEYKKAPDVTRRRLYLEAMTEILPTLSNKIILDEKAGNFLPLMQLQQNQAAPQVQPQNLIPRR